ncbi:MAG: S41 family peptidase [Methanoregula sp.]|nr:S41 family peptidase [Methanoregula sp.]
MQSLKNSLVIAGLLVSALLVFLIFPVTAQSVGSSDCPSCGMVWKDTCVPFELNNETAYNVESEAANSQIAKNLTPYADFSMLPASSAFLSLHNLMKERYAFTQWRSIDWDTLYKTYAPKIADAEKNQDKALYYRALRQYLFEIPDAHVGVLADSDFGAKYADVGGGFGFAVTQLDSGKFGVSYVANGSAADIAGIRPGDHVIAWNGKPVADAINATPHIWSATKPSTAEGILLQKQRFLTRAPVGTPATVVLASAGSPSRTINLTASDDGYDTLTKTTTFLGKQVKDVGTAHPWDDVQPQLSNDTVTYRTLPGGYSYIAIYGESYPAYQPFKAAMLSAMANNTPGIVIDLRYNGGGDDNIASCFAGWFVNKPVFYEYATKYDPGAKQFAITSEAWTQPRPNAYKGPIAVMVSPYTISSGEGLPLMFANSGTGKIISWYGTNGAFGMNAPQAIMPFGLIIAFPDGASLDQNRMIQDDSNASLVGGVAPQIRVPLNEDTVARSMAGEDVQLTYALKWLDSQQKPQTPAATSATSTPTQKAAPGIGIVLLAVGLLMVIGRRK